MPTTADSSAVSGPPAIDAGLARRLADTQFPQWAGLPLRVRLLAERDQATRAAQTTRQITAVLADRPGSGR